MADDFNPINPPKPKPRKAHHRFTSARSWKCRAGHHHGQKAFKVAYEPVKTFHKRAHMPKKKAADLLIRFRMGMEDMVGGKIAAGVIYNPDVGPLFPPCAWRKCACSCHPWNKYKVAELKVPAPRSPPPPEPTPLPPPPEGWIPPGNNPRAVETSESE